MFRKLCNGIEITHTDIHLLRVKKSNAGVVVHAAKSIKVDFFKMDITAATQFLREQIAPFCGKNSQVSLAIPDRFGRIMLTWTDAEWGSHDEATSVLKWKLKRDIADIEKYRIDFQVVSEREDGHKDIVVALAENTKISQIEKTFTAAGLHPGYIGLSTINSYNFYRHRLDLGEDFVLLRVCEDSFGLIVFHKHQPILFRTVKLPFNRQDFFREMSRTKSVLARKNFHLSKVSFFLSATSFVEQDSCGVLEDVFEKTISILAPHFDLAGEGDELPLVTSFPQYVAAAGAAEFNLR